MLFGGEKGSMGMLDCLDMKVVCEVNVSENTCLSVCLRWLVCRPVPLLSDSFLSAPLSDPVCELVSLSVCLSVRLSECLSLPLSLCLRLCRSVCGASASCCYLLICVLGCLRRSKRQCETYTSSKTKLFGPQVRICTNI